MKAYKSIGGNRHLKLLEMLILVAVISMYCGVVFAVLGQMIK